MVDRHCENPAARCNPILPLESKLSQLPNPALRGRMATPVGATGRKVRFVRHPPRTPKSKIPPAVFGECIGEWLLKNSSAGRGPKLRRVRMPYKRFSRVAQAFSIPQNHAVFVDIDFFNSHAIYRQVRFRLPIASGQPTTKSDAGSVISRYE
jgi:hypothetical protein